MALAEFPALPLWTDAYLADTNHLTDAERGRYDLLLIHLWRAPNQRLPNDNAWLARKFQRSVEAIEIEIRPIVQEFCKVDGNWIYQKRLTAEWSYVKRLSNRGRENAKSRWQKEKDACEPDASQHASGNAPTPTPTPHKKGSATQSRPRREATRMPDGWMLSVEGLDFAKSRGFPDQQILDIADHFKTHYTAGPGRNKTHADWAAAWRNWLTRETPRNPGVHVNGARPNSKPGPLETLVAGFARTAREIESKG